MMPVILAVHFPAKKLAKLRMSAMQLGAKVRIVEKWEYIFAGNAGRKTSPSCPESCLDGRKQGLEHARTARGTAKRA